MRTVFLRLLMIFVELIRSYWRNEINAKKIAKGSSWGLSFQRLIWKWLEDTRRADNQQLDFCSAIQWNTRKHIQRSSPASAVSARTTSFTNASRKRTTSCPQKRWTGFGLANFPTSFSKFRSEWQMACKVNPSTAYSILSKSAEEVGDESISRRIREDPHIRTGQQLKTIMTAVYDIGPCKKGSQEQMTNE